MSQFIENLFTENVNFKLAVVQKVTPNIDYSQAGVAEIDGAFEAKVGQLLEFYLNSQGSPAFSEIPQLLPKVGETVTWDNGSAIGIVAKSYTEHKSLTIKGVVLVCNGSPDDPALLINLKKGRDLKLASEVAVTSEAEQDSDNAIAFSFDFDGRYDDIDLTPTKGMVEAAKQALTYLKSGYGGDGLQDETIRWVKKVVAGDSLSIEKCKKGYKFFKRHNFFKMNKNPGDTNPNKPAPWYVARLCWFGDPGEQFFNRVWKQIKVADADLDFSECHLDFGCIVHKVIQWNGIELGVEYRPGDVRWAGKKYARKLKSGYGHCRNFIGTDGMSLDCYLSSEFFKPYGSPSDRIFEVTQMSPKDDAEERKMMIGYQDIEQAKEAYLAEMNSEYFRGIHEVSIDHLDYYRKPKPPSEPNQPNYNYAEQVADAISETLKPYAARLDELQTRLDFAEKIKVSGEILDQSDYDELAKSDAAVIDSAIAQWVESDNTDTQNLVTSDPKP